jgi:hypothetical protein
VRVSLPLLAKQTESQQLGYVESDRKLPKSEYLGAGPNATKTISLCGSAGFELATSYVAPGRGGDAALVANETGHTRAIEARMHMQGLKFLNVHIYSFILDEEIIHQTKTNCSSRCILLNQWWASRLT